MPKRKPITAKKGDATPPSNEPTRVFFPIAKVNALRKRAVKACPSQDDGPDDWSISKVDPMDLLGVFTSLSIKPGFILRAYQFLSGGNGNGFVLAMPVDAPFPEASECPRLTDRFLDPPKPPLSLDYFMEAIELDGTPWSYFSASLFAREAQEFGAIWHGCSWSTHTILGANPVEPSPTPTRRSSKKKEASDDPDPWTWNEPIPSEWRPSFEQVNDQITITFFTISGLCPGGIYRHNDTFRECISRFTWNDQVVAEGHGGFVF